MKIGIVGTGYVGSTAAYCLVLQGVASEIVLVDHQPSLAAAQAMDLRDATPFCHPVLISSGDFAALAGCQLVVIAAGVSQQPGETRLDLLQKNALVFADIMPKIIQSASDSVFLIATNPLDIMTQVATTLAVRVGIPACRVFGSGTILDTARFRTLLSQLFGVAPSSVHACVVGEHGDSEVLVWSGARIAGVSLEEFAQAKGVILTEEMKRQVEQDVRGAAYKIIAGKGSTYFGVGTAIASLCRSVLYDERVAYTVCSVMPSVEGVENIALSLPHIIGRDGIQMTVVPPLNPAEKSALRQSAEIIRVHMEKISF